MLVLVVLGLLGRCCVRRSRARGAPDYPPFGFAVAGEHSLCSVSRVAPVPHLGGPHLFHVQPPYVLVCHPPIEVLLVVVPGRHLAPEREGGTAAV